MLFVLEGIVIAIGFTLIPDGAADGIGDHPVNHAIKDGSCLLWVLLVIGCHFLIRLKGFSRYPGFDACAAPGTIDQTHRNIELSAQLASKEIGGA